MPRTGIQAPYQIRPRDFDQLNTYAIEHPDADEYAENIAWNEDGTKFQWWLYFAMLREAIATEPA